MVDHKDSVDVWHVVNGAGGTGKSVAILKKAKRYLEEDPECSVLYVVGKTKKLKEMIEFWTDGDMDNYGGRFKKDRFDDLRKEYGFGRKIYDDEFDREKIDDAFKNTVETGIKGKPIYDHVFIDEAQDMTPRELYLFSRLAENSFTLIGSKKQSIFVPNGENDRYWENLLNKVAGAYTPKKEIYTSELKIQQRIGNPNIIKVANNISRYSSNGFECGETCELLDENVNEPLSEDRPMIIRCRDEESEMKALTRQINDLPKPENGGDWTIGVLRIKKDKVRETKAAFDRGCSDRWREKSYLVGVVDDSKPADVIYSKDNAVNGGVFFLTVANSKGLDFDCVFIFFDDYVYCKENTDHKIVRYLLVTKNTGGKSTSARNNLYVSVTRPRAILTVMILEDNYPDSKVQSILGDSCDCVVDENS